MIFESLRQVDEDGRACWLARELMALPECATRGKSKRVIQQATVGYLEEQEQPAPVMKLCMAY